MNEAPQENLEKKPNFFAKLGGWIKKHKVITALLAVVVVGGILAAVFAPKLLAPQSTDPVYSFIRTVTLAKGDLDSVVSVTGTVNSNNTSNVTYSGSAMSAPKVKTVEVAVGDYVSEGDVIVTLDTADILESISKEQENIADRKKAAQKSYDKAVEAYDDADDELDDYKSTYNTASNDYDSAYKVYKPAYDSVTKYQKAYDKAVAARQEAGNKLNSASSNLLATPTDISVQTLQENYDRALTAEKAALTELTAAKTNSNYELLSKTYEAAKTAYEQADKQYTALEKAVKNAKDAVETAKENLDDASTSDTLEDLNEQLDDCKLTAETSGKVTSLSAEVGSTPSGTVAVIQDVEDLIIAVTIEEADINNVAIGMPCRITSDATGNTVINGTLTQIDPVASQSGTFGAEVTVEDSETGLLVGMNASVDIVISSTADCFTVPIDAIGNDDDGKGDYVYRKTGGEGVDLTFEKVYVTTGEKNDYYIEISSANLAAGDTIRATSDLTQGIESAAASGLEAMMSAGMEGPGTYGGGMGGNMPGGGEMRTETYTFEG